VVTASGELPDRCRLRATARDAPVVVFTAAGNEPKLAGWAADGCEVVPLPDRETFIDAVLADLGKRRMTNVLVEGGAGLLGSFVDAGAVDELHIFVAPKLVGGAGPSPVAGTGVAKIADALRLAEFTSEPCGEDVYLHGLPAG
jgi:diaminohydroxyphosphoribosylaminopyrimidine deaminase/5-amino-6-(5-phosphoribosylamino)uracil reductase